MTKTIYIHSTMIGKKSFFSSRPMQIDGDQMARDMDASIRDMEKEGYQLLSFAPITSSHHNSMSYPYQYTEGMILVFQFKSKNDFV